MKKNGPTTLKIIVILILIFMNLVFASSGFSSEKGYYVAENGSDTNPGSTGRPWRTIQHAVRSTKAGDTILVRGGTYNEGEIWLRKEHGHGGRPGSFLVIKAYPGEKPIFVNGGRPFVIECDYVRIEGLQFRNGKGIAIRGGNRNGIQVVNNSFTGSGYAWGAVDSHGDNILLEGNECDIKGNTVGTQGHCYYIGNGDNITVRNNTARGMTGYGIHIFDQRRSEDPPNFERLIKGVIIEANTLSDSEQRAGIVVAAYDHARIENVIIRNNIVHDNAGGGILIREISKDIRVYNNTIYGNRGPAVFVGGDRQEVDTVAIRNNIFDISEVQERGATVYHVVADKSNPSIILENNLYWPMPLRIRNVSDSSSVVGAPGFKNTKQKDFHLEKGSAAIDKGLTLSDVPIDKEGTERPKGAGFDIGAYEYQ